MASMQGSRGKVRHRNNRSKAADYRDKLESTERTRDGLVKLLNSLATGSVWAFVKWRKNARKMLKQQAEMQRAQAQVAAQNDHS
jgi:hypothetical protein